VSFFLLWTYFLVDFAFLRFLQFKNLYFYSVFISLTKLFKIRKKYHQRESCLIIGICLQVWMFQRFTVVMEYQQKPVLPPPFIAFCHFYSLLKYCVRKAKGEEGMSKFSFVPCEWIIWRSPPNRTALTYKFFVFYFLLQCRRLSLSFSLSLSDYTTCTRKRYPNW